MREKKIVPCSHSNEKSVETSQLVAKVFNPNKKKWSYKIDEES